MTPTGSPARSGRSQPTRAQLIGRALKRLRLASGLTQSQAADHANTRQQTWQRYEAGQSDAVLRLNVLERLAKAVGADLEELNLEISRLDEPLPAARRSLAAAPFRRDDDPYALPLVGHVRAGPQGLHVHEADAEPEEFSLRDFFGPDWRVAPVAGESMIPYAEPGGFVAYNLRRPPARNKGCVILTKAGDLYVKRYDGISGDKLFVTELFPVERQIEFAMDEVEGLYAVGFRVG